MPWNNSGDGPGSSGSNPWGSPGGTPGGPSNGQRPGDRGGDRGSDRAGQGDRRGNNSWNGQPPNLDEAIASAQAWVRRSLPRGLGGGPGGGGRRGGLGAGPWGGRGLALLGLAVVAVWLASGFYRVQPDQQGVVLRFGAYNRTTFPGLNYHLPWPVESALTPAVTRINRAEIGFRVSPDGSAIPQQFQGRRDVPTRDVSEEALMLTGDENIIDINFSVFWRIRDASAFLFNTRNPGYTVKSAAESVMREVIGRTPIQPALTEARAQIEQSVTTGTQAILDQYGSGVEITQVQLQKVDPPDAVIDSFRDVQRANTDSERLRNEAESYRNDVIPRARGDAARLIADAEGVRQSLIAEATGQAQRFLSVYQAYSASKEVTLRRLYIETMQEILTRTPTVIVDDQVRSLVPFLPLGDLRAAPVPPVAQPSQGSPNQGSPIPAPPRAASGATR